MTATLPYPNIANDIRERYKVSHRAVQRALALWQNENREAYKAVLVPGVDRYDLEGKANGTVETARIPVPAEPSPKSADPA